MGKLWKDVYWLCILQIFYRAITVSNCTYLYMWPLYVYTLSRSLLIFMRAHLNPHGPGHGNIQGITDRSARGCACVPVCVGMREYPFFVESALWLLTDCCLFGHQVICNYTVLYYGHHRGCLNNPIFSNLGLCAACWAHFMCHHELWPTSVSHPFSSLNSSFC